MKTKLAAWYLLSSIFYLLLTSARAQQTNTWYTAGETTISLAPVISTPANFDFGKYTLYGYALQTMHWTSPNIGAGLEVGTRDFRQFQSAEIDHIAILAAVRYQPWPTAPALGRLSIHGTVATEEWFDDGSKGITLGIGAEYALSLNSRVFADAAHRFETSVAKTGDAVSIGLKYRF